MLNMLRSKSTVLAVLIALLALLAVGCANEPANLEPDPMMQQEEPIGF